MDSTVVDVILGLLWGLTAGRIGRPNGPRAAERRLRAFRSGRFVMIPLTAVHTKIKAKRGTDPVEIIRKTTFEVRAGGASGGLKLGWWEESALGTFEEFILRAQSHVEEINDGFEEITTHDVKGSLAHLRAQRSDFVILQEVCSGER